MYRLALGNDPVTGKMVRKTWTFRAKNKTMAGRIADELRGSLKPTEVIGTDAAVSVLFDEWLRHLKAQGRAVTTLHEHRRSIEKNINPTIGAIPLKDLGVRDLDMLYDKLLTRNPPLSASSVQRCHRVISAALRQAVTWGWLDVNPADRATIPRSRAKAIIAPTTQQVQELTAALHLVNPVYGDACSLATVTGARRGELCALRWTDLDGDVLLITKSIYKIGHEYGVKSTKSGLDRPVVLGSQAMAVLKRRRAEQFELAQKVGVSLPADAYILSTWPDGSRPLNPDTLTRAFGRVAQRLGMPEIHFHSLRHYAATAMMARGISAKDTADRLGHVDPTMTLRVYAHATHERQRAAADVLDLSLETTTTPQP